MRLFSSGPSLPPSAHPTSIRLSLKASARVRAPLNFRRRIGRHYYRHFAFYDRLERFECATIPRPFRTGIRPVGVPSCGVVARIEKRLFHKCENAHQRSGVAAATAALPQDLDEEGTVVDDHFAGPAAPRLTRVPWPGKNPRRSTTRAW